MAICIQNTCTQTRWSLLQISYYVCCPLHLATFYRPIAYFTFSMKFLYINLCTVILCWLHIYNYDQNVPCITGKHLYSFISLHIIYTRSIVGASLHSQRLPAISKDAKQPPCWCTRPYSHIDYVSCNGSVISYKAIQQL